jgi:ATP-dependent Lon protease
LLNLFVDEIDKLGKDFRGDPASALLEVLDPEQNLTFTDHYINIPLDLSNVLFIATANEISTIPAPLQDRMEVIDMAGYTFDEKLHIARDHLIPKQTRIHGLPLDSFIITDSHINSIACGYTREAGVRNLERKLAALCRFKAVQYAECKEANNLSSYLPQVSDTIIEEVLGVRAN